MISTQEFFYDSQVRRFIIQFIRLCSGFQVQYGDDALQTVPVMYGDPSRQAATILKQNSENIMNTVPAMAAYVTDLDYDRKRMQEPYFVDKKQVRMRARDQNTGELTTQQGNAFSIERLMPVPYLLKMKLDIWTSNTTQKLQLWEQFAPLFNPSFEIQSSDNYFDWTSLTTVNLDDQTWTSRSVPTGATDEIDIATFSFTIPIWLSPPSKVKKLGVIRRIVSSVYDINFDSDVTDGFDTNLLMGERVRITPLKYDLILLNGELTLHNQVGFVNPDNDELGTPVAIDENIPLWATVFDHYKGEICDGISKISLIMNDEMTEITGTITAIEDDPNRLLFDIDTDTIPANDLNPINAIINPLKTGPGVSLPVAALGQRYMILDDIGFASDSELATAWQGASTTELVAKKNDIIEYNGSEWTVVFDAENSINEVHFTTNLTTQIQLHWDKTKWVKSFEGEYLSGMWSIIY